MYGNQGKDEAIIVNITDIFFTEIMKGLKYLICCLIIYVALCCRSYAQSKAYVEDLRVVKFQKEIFKYALGNSDIYNSKDFDLKVQVAPCLDIYCDTVFRPLLLIKIQPANSPYFSWGILTDNSYCFFKDADDLNEIDFSAFKKRHSQTVIETISAFCYKYQPQECDCFTPKANGIFDKNINIVRDALHKAGGISLTKAVDMQRFFENITGIKAINQSNARSINQLTSQDYTNWLNWYKVNYAKLYWDDKRKQVMVK